MAGFWTRALVSIRGLGATAALLGAPVLEAGSLDWRQSSAGNFDYGRQLTLPAGFGSGEFTFEVWIRPNNSFQVGSTAGGGQLTNWSSEDFTPYSSSGWWFNGNFLLDGHNNANSNFQNGTFSLQLYGGGRVRWLFGDGASGGLQGNLWAVQAPQTSSAPTLLDGDWHHVALVRRFSGASQSTLELWVDGTLIDTETSSARTNMATTYWNNWSGFPSGQQGWFWGAEKQAALGSSWEDYKGLIDELRFWSRAKNSAELGPSQYANPVTGSETGLVGWYDFNEGGGTSTCSSIVASQCMTLHNTVAANVWNAGEAPTTGGVSDTTAPSVPQALQATPASSTTINLTWNASTDNAGGSGVASYRVQRGGATVAASVAGTSFGDTGLIANTTYSYTVSAVDVAGNRSAESAAAQATTPVPADTTPPSVPANFAANATSSTSITLSWTAATDNIAVTGYRVRRAGSATVIGNPTGLTFVDNSRTPSTTYNYTLTAVDAAGNESGPPATASATTPAPPADTIPPTVPGNPQAVATSTTTISLTWTGSSDNIAVTGYRVQRGGVTVAANVTGTTFGDTGLTPNTAYSYTVSAVDAAGNRSGESATASATTMAVPDTMPPTVPANVVATPTSSTTVSLTWSASTDNVAVTTYRVRRGGVTIAANVAGTSFDDSNLTPSTAYSYTVSAVDGAGNRSAESAAAPATTPAFADTIAPTVPTNLAAVAASATTVNLTWTASTDAIGVASYRVQRDGVVIASSVTGTSFSDTGRTQNTTYSYTVSAVDAAGNRSVESGAAQVTTPTAPGSSSGGEPSRSGGSLDWLTLLAGLALLIGGFQGRSRSLTAGTPPTIA